MGPSFHKVHNWPDLERHLVLIVAHMIRNKRLVPLEVIWMEIEAAPIVIDSLFQSMTGIQWIWEAKVLKTVTYVIKTAC